MTDKEAFEEDYQAIKAKVLSHPITKERYGELFELFKDSFETFWLRGRRRELQLLTSGRLSELK